MAETSFIVKNSGNLRVRIEPTDVVGAGSRVFPSLTLQPKLQLLPLQGAVNYTLLRLAGRLFVGNETSELTTFESSPLAEASTPQGHDRPLNVMVPLNPGQIKHIEEVRNGKNPFFKIHLTGLVAIHPGNEFEMLREIVLQLDVPRSHWIDRALNVWGVSDLRLLEINFPGNGRKEMATARERLGRAEQLYRTGDYSHVLTELRSAFNALGECYSGGTAVDKATWEKLLVNTHPSARGQLLDLLSQFRNFLHLGPHEALPTTQAPTPISRHDARLALIVAHAIFEYFVLENWPGI
jgi:hypothetical protein